MSDISDQCNKIKRFQRNKIVSLSFIQKAIFNKKNVLKFYEKNVKKVQTE